MYGGGRLRLG